LVARARRGAGDIQMASISAKLLPISTRNLADADLPSREKGERQTVLADSYSIVLQPLIWISYGHSIRRFSLSRPKLRRRGCHRFPWKSVADCASPYRALWQKNEAPAVVEKRAPCMVAHLLILLAKGLSCRFVLRKIANPRDSAVNYGRFARRFVAADNSCEASLLSEL